MSKYPCPRCNKFIYASNGKTKMGINFVKHVCNCGAWIVYDNGKSVFIPKSEHDKNHKGRFD